LDTCGACHIVAVERLREREGGKRWEGPTDRRREGGREGGKGERMRNVSERMLLVHPRCGGAMDDVQRADGG